MAMAQILAQRASKKCGIFIILFGTESLSSCELAFIAWGLATRKYTR